MGKRRAIKSEPDPAAVADGDGAAGNQAEVESRKRIRKEERKREVSGDAAHVVKRPREKTDGAHQPGVSGSAQKPGSSKKARGEHKKTPRRSESIPDSTEGMRFSLDLCSAYCGLNRCIYIYVCFCHKANPNRAV